MVLHSIMTEMKKEIIIAILLGLSLGLFITYGLYRSRNSANDKSVPSIQEVLENPDKANVLSTLVLHSPDDESIVSESEITIAGDTQPNNFVVIFVNEENFITTADDAGAFSISAELEDGSNVILIHSVDEDGKETVEERMVVYTDKPLDQAEDEPSDEESDES